MRKNPKRVPRFRSEDEERKFWARHSPLDFEHGPILRGQLFPNLKPTTVLTSIRLPLWLLNALKGIANKKDIPTQSLMKMYLSEKVEAEMRSGSRRQRSLH